MNAGPYTNISCYPNTSIDHAVLLVGYNQTHWTIKNSWNTGWGNNGYGYIDKVNNTGLQKYAFIIQVNLPWNPVPLHHLLHLQVQLY
jgi:C1A family cysteine protease